ncbi:prolyl oligopeptidase family serine peptidase [Streptomyces sp. AC495_CC817]|uniref:prolyl oligopeptidase family serine peptidase n=1 Tax=Streptomyces sp. AC495_CC817 TaxID=2823900 RepID=UPI001C259EC3|nr:prolyl oligopeptidase family serine peptidase [Streptomyces sp. AC495_CC817]
MSAPRAALDAALALAERHGRPGLPVGGFALARADGRPRRGIHRLDGRTVIEPDGHIHRFSPSPDRRLLAVEWAPTADENGVLGIVDAVSGAMRLHPDVRLRYDTVLWAEDSRTLDVVASRDGMLVTLDVETGETGRSALDPSTRYRLFPGGASGVRAESSRDGTRLIDRATGTTLGRWRALHRAAPLGAGVLVWHDGGIDAVSDDGAVLWRWSDPLARIVDLAVDGDRVVVLAVAQGAGVLLELVDGVEASRTSPVLSADDALTVTAVGADGGVLRLAVEGPLTPPLIVERAGHDAPVSPPSRLPGATARHDIPADDGTPLTVHVTSPPGAAEGPRPLILTCYGGFGVPHLPLFEPTIPAWLAHGGVYASAQLRGGGERGSAWRDAGRGARKHRTIADLADAARGLVTAGVTTPDRLVLVGASLGGVVAAACALEHPELCAGFATTASPLDLLALEEHPLGSLWRDEFGDDGTTEARERLRLLSPLARAEALPTGTPLPSYLGIVLDEDTRILARDTHRLAETLRRAGGSARTWTATGAGHGANEPDALHELGLAVLEFAAEVTSGAAR